MAKLRIEVYPWPNDENPVPGAFQWDGYLDDEWYASGTAPGGEDANISAAIDAYYEHVYDWSKWGW